MRHFVGLEGVRPTGYCVPTVGEKAVEQRQHNRYRVAAHVSFTWESADRSIHQGEGITRDCGLTGAFVVTSEKLQIGSVLQMNFALPPLLAAGRGARLKTRGRVVRTDSDGFAVVADLGPGSLLHRKPAVYESLGSGAE